MKKFLYIALLIFGSTLLMPQIVSSQDKFELVKFDVEDGGSIEGAFFSAKSKKAVIFAHGAIFNKESWYFLTEKFQNLNVASLSIDFRGYGNSKAGSTDKKYYDILGAIAYLNDQGFTDINVVGGSMGGAAVLSALPHTPTPISKVVVLAPAGGPPITSEQTNKFFVVSKEEGLYSRVTSIYNESAEPKKIKEYPGSTHAQHMFKTDYAEELATLILKFIGND